MKFSEKKSVLKCCVYGTVCAVIMSFTSCVNNGENSKKSVKPVELSENLSLCAEIKYNDFDCSADLKREGQTWECKFKSPKSIKGMTVLLSSDVCKIDYGELKYQLDRNNLSEASPVSIITKTMDKLVLQKDLSCHESEVANGAHGGKKQKTVTEKGSVSGTDFTAVIKNKKLTSLNVGDFLSVKFK